MEQYKQLIEIATDLFGGRMEETKELITTDDIRSKVYIIRGQQVMLDKDLAEIYGYEVKKLNQQVKRNIERFPEDFMFRLSNSEIDSVRSQIVTSRKKDFFAGQEGGRRYLPYAFTEQGIYMLATVLRGKLAEQQSIFIMRTFREMRHYIRQNQQFVTRNEMDLLTAKVGTITERQDRTENKVDSIQKDVTILADNFITDTDKKNFVIYKGQKLEADIAYIEIYQQAKKSIYVVDDYMNAKSLQHLSQKADGVEVVLFTENGKGGKGFLTKSLVTDFQNEYPSLRIKPTILSDMDSLDYEDKHYQRRKTDLENHLYKTYDKIDEAEELLVSAKAKKRSLLADKITGDNIYKALIFFDKLYAQMNEAEKREFLSQLVDNVQIYKERKENGQWLKSIEFKLPIIEKEFTLSLDNDTQNETVVLLSRKS